MFHSIQDIAAANARLGHHWFEPATRRFFRSRTSATIYQLPDGSALFVTSERGPHQHAPRYSVHIAAPDGRIDTVGEFQQFATRDAAHRVAADLALAIQIKEAHSHA